MPGGQAFGKRGEETPAAVTPPAQEDHRVIGPGSLIVVGDTDAPSIGVPHLLLLRTENKYHRRRRGGSHTASIADLREDVPGPGQERPAAAAIVRSLMPPDRRTPGGKKHEILLMFLLTGFLGISKAGNA